MSQVRQGKTSVVKPMILSHGPLMCKDLARSRRFYEEFRWEIQHEPRAIDDFFGRGDIVDMSVVATDSAESHD